MTLVIPPRGLTGIQWGGRRFNGPTEVDEAFVEELRKIGFIICESPPEIESSIEEEEEELSLISEEEDSLGE